MNKTVPSKPLKYNRILLKLSGESFRGEKNYGIDSSVLSFMSNQIKDIFDLGVQIGIVVGGGNIIRGSEAEMQGMDRASADHAGMLATVINALLLQDSLEKIHKIDTRIQSALNITEVAEPYIRRRAIRHLEKNRVVIFAAGTGNPFMSTDTAAALRAIEIDANVVLMAKNDVDGIYESDPKLDPKAIKFESLPYFEALQKRLGVMDSTALSLCMDNNLPLIVFDLFNPESLKKIALGDSIGSLVTSE